MADHDRYADRKVLTYKHKSDKDRTMTVYEGTGAHDALATDEAWERKAGKDAPAKIAAKTEKVGQDAHEVEDLPDGEKRQVAAQAGVSNDPDELEDLSGKQAVDETVKRGRVRK